jgi:hypothetical protein
MQSAAVRQELQISIHNEAEIVCRSTSEQRTTECFARLWKSDLLHTIMLKTVINSLPRSVMDLTAQYVQPV